MVLISSITKNYAILIKGLILAAWFSLRFHHSNKVDNSSFHNSSFPSPFYFDSNLFLLNETWDGFKHKIIFCIVYRKNWNKKKAFSQLQRLKSRNTYLLGTWAKKIIYRPTDPFFNGRVTANKLFLINTWCSTLVKHRYGLISCWNASDSLIQHDFDIF